MLYIICIYLLMFSNYLDMGPRYILGFVLIGTVILGLVYNAIVILIVTLTRAKLLLKKLKNKSMQNTTDLATGEEVAKAKFHQSQNPSWIWTEAFATTKFIFL